MGFSLIKRLLLLLVLNCSFGFAAEPVQFEVPPFIKKLVDKKTQDEAKIDKFFAWTKTLNGEQTHNFLEYCVANVFNIDPSILAELMEQVGGLAQACTPIAVANFSQMHADAIAGIMEDNPESVDQFFGLFDPKFRAHVENDETLTQSAAHIRENKKLIIYTSRMERVPNGYSPGKSSGFVLFQHMDLVNKLLSKEKELAENGYFTAYHAQRSDLYVPIALNTLLYGLRAKKDVNDFLLLHTKPDPLYEQAKKLAGKGLSLDQFKAQYSKIEQTILEAQASERQRLLQRPCKHQDDDDDQDMKNLNHMLFLNDSLFGNVRTGRGSLYWFQKNEHCSDVLRKKGKLERIDHNIGTIFAHHGLQKYESKFGKEVKELAEEYVDLSKYGTFYLLGIPLNNVNKSICPTTLGGTKTLIQVDGKPTDDMQKIAAALRTDKYVEPCNEKEYVGLMTSDKDGLLNPDSGLKVFPHRVVKDQGKYAQWETKWQNLQARITKDVEQERNQLWPYQSQV